MKYSNFVHLHTHSQYSLLDGACRLDSVIALAKEFKMPALAITDHGNMFAAIEFYKKASKAGIKPIIGTEAYVAGGSRFDKKPSNIYPNGGFHMILLAKDITGYRNLMKLSTAGFLEGFYHRPRIDRELLKQHSEGLIATTACLAGEVNWHLQRGETDQAVATAREFEEIFGKGNFFIEIQDHGLEKEKLVMPKLIAISKETGIPLVATNDCHYLRREDWEAHDALLCIQTDRKVDDTDRMRYNSDQIYFKSPQEMEQVFGDYKEAMENTVRIAEACNLEMELGQLKLPVFPIPRPFVEPDAFLKHLCDEGLKSRYPEITKEISKRLDYELGVIKVMGYAGYFLIVKDFCDYARSQGIPVGPGRGSAAGSLVSYALKITNVDPIKFELLFERFLNPERISMPDIDIDFADRGRDKIIKYVIEKYGSDNVTQIITFGTMAARGVVRDVGRVLGFAYSEVDRIAKLIPAKLDITLEEAIQTTPELAELVKKDQRVARLINYSKTLEGLARHCSTHAAGVVIAPSALTNYVPLFKGSKDEVTTQYDMKMVEEIGLLKMDFLGLRTLTVIDDAVRMIHENHPNVKIDIDNLPLDDPKVFELFARGETIGIFQFESQGMTQYLKKLKPEAFTDLSVMNALYRPGPLDARVEVRKGQELNMIDIYIERKKGTLEVSYLDPHLEKILGETYGVIVFQEQVLQIANKLAGYSLGQADLLRKAMGKKDAALMAGQKKEFLEGALAHGANEKVAGEVFDQIETFARYGFNKAHATCYALVAYQTAYLKRYYPREFMAALMSSEITNADRIYIMLEEARRLGVTVEPPDVNESRSDFAVVGDKIRFGLQAVKNVGEDAANAIAEARRNGSEFKTLADLVTNVPHKYINRRSLESLISAGACDSLEGNRAQKFEAVEAYLEYAHRVAEQSSSHDLFAGSSGTISRVAPPLPNKPDWGSHQRLQQEKAMLGFYISGHPLDKFRDELNCFSSNTTMNLKGVPDGREVTVGGIVAQIKKMPDKKGNLMAFVTLEDFAGSVELICFSDCYDKNKEHIEIDRMVLVTGRVTTREEEQPKILVAEVLPLDRIAERFNCQLVIRIDKGLSEQLMDQALLLLSEYRGTVPVLLAARENGSEVYIRSRKYAVAVDFRLLDALKELLGDSSAYLRPLPAKASQVE
ncbi:MAG: DNA polymerase III subunit alpha [Candidatus Zixiibacteriota bacterium]